jgi:hypothetical protein
MSGQKIKRTKLLFLSFCGLFLLPTIGCGHFKSPSTVVHSVYMDCNNGEYPKARHLFTQDLRAQSDGSLEANGLGIKMVCDRLTNSGSITEVDIKGETIRGDRATVVADVQFNSGATRSGERTDLVREDGVWKVALQ